MKLIKITQDHYIIVDDSEIKEGDWLYSFDNGLIVQANRGSVDTINSKSLNGRGYGKITHSTQPLNCNCSNRGYKLDTNCAERNSCFDKVQYLPIQEVKELIGEVDVLQESKNYVLSKFKSDTDSDQLNCYKHIETYIQGYNQAIEDNKDKKYTEEDLKYMFECGRNYQNNAEITFKVSMEYIQPKTEWKVELIDGQLKLKQ